MYRFFFFFFKFKASPIKTVQHDPEDSKDPYLSRVRMGLKGLDGKNDFSEGW